VSSRRITPGARSRRALLLDAVLGAIVAAIALGLAAGLGVVAFFALPVLLILLAWIGAERLLTRVRRRRAV
jgi:hypothetical protein